MAHAIALLPGDGIGPEVVAEARRVLERVQALSGGEVELELESFDVGAGTWRRTGYSATSSPWDVSLANGSIYGGIALDGGWKYVYGQMYWGPIYNNAGQQAFAPYTHWEPIGWRYCG